MKKIILGMIAAAALSACSAPTEDFAVARCNQLALSNLKQYGATITDNMVRIPSDYGNIDFELEHVDGQGVYATSAKANVFEGEDIGVYGRGMIALWSGAFKGISSWPKTARRNGYTDILCKIVVYGPDVRILSQTFQNY